MKQWDVVMFPFETIGLHPAVILSSDEICRSPRHDSVNALICTTVRGGRHLTGAEVRLNGADGMDWPTAVRCDQIFLLRKTSFKEIKGSVTPERRRQIGRRITEIFRLLGF